MKLKDAIGNQTIAPRKRGRPKKLAKGHTLTLTRKDFDDKLILTAQQHCDRVAHEFAAQAGEMVRCTLKDMSLIVSHLREMIPFADSKGLKDITDSYRGAVTEIRRALGLSEDVAGSQQKTLVSIQCVGEVHVQGPEGSSGMKPLPQMPDLSKLLPPE